MPLTDAEKVDELSTLDKVNIHNFNSVKFVNKAIKDVTSLFNSCAQLLLDNASTIPNLLSNTNCVSV